MAKKDLIDAVSELILEFDKYIDSVINKKIQTTTEAYFDSSYIFYAKISAAAKILGINTDEVTYDDPTLALRQINNNFRKFKGQFASMKAMEEFSTLIDSDTVELSRAEIAQIQEMINESRDLISSARWIPPSHKRRILLGLERLQKEIHKAKSDYDIALARVAEAGAILGEFGEDAKPFADLIERIFGIFRGKKDEPLALPNPRPKQLPPPEKQLEGTSKNPCRLH